MRTSENQGSRLFYIDNLRIFLIGLVVLLHLNITYGAPGDWYYNESHAGFPEIIPMAMFNATNQAFFMGMFFFISAFFMAPSLKRKGIWKFVKDRLIRLGIPLVLFYFILNPLTNFIRNRVINAEDPTFSDYLANGWARGVGPMWFVGALVIFTAVYLLIYQVKFKIQIKFPGNRIFIVAAILTGLLQFIIRIWLPVGWSMPFTNFQLPHFLQYILLFVFGIVAYQNNWLESVTYKMGKQWFIFAQILIFIGFPLLFFGGGAASGNLDVFRGGLHWQSIAYAIWEQLVGFSLIIGLFGISKQYFNRQGRLATKLSESAYGVFVFHAPIIVGISALFVDWEIFPLLKFVVLAPIALIASFGIAWFIKRMPLLKSIF